MKVLWKVSPVGIARRNSPSEKEGTISWLNLVRGNACPSKGLAAGTLWLTLWLRWCLVVARPTMGAYKVGGCSHTAAAIGTGC